MFTDHKTQGQTLENVMVNIGTMKKFPVTPFLAYIVWVGPVIKQRVGHHQTIETFQQDNIHKASFGGFVIRR
jgi:hypothetical protein